MGSAAASCRWQREDQPDLEVLPLVFVLQRQDAGVEIVDVQACCLVQSCAHRMQQLRPELQHPKRLSSRHDCVKQRRIARQARQEVPECDVAATSKNY
jgi:hypothetical protein